MIKVLYWFYADIKDSQDCNVVTPLQNALNSEDPT